MQGPSAFQDYLRRHELGGAVAAHLVEVIPRCDVVMLCDDSDSMNQPIAEEGTDAFAVKKSTRWLELKKLCAALIEMLTAAHPYGLDIHFLNRPPVRNVTSPQGLGPVFAFPPSGATPLAAALTRIFAERAESAKLGPVLVVVVTDGEPTSMTSKDPRGELFQVLTNKHRNIHVSFAECTDQEDDMEYLDLWDGQIPNFDNTDDYREELARVKAVQGQQFKFDYTDYCAKVVLATFVRWYFNLDQSRFASQRSTQDISHFPLREHPPPIVPVTGFPSLPQGGAPPSAFTVEDARKGVWVRKPGSKARGGGCCFKGKTWHPRYLWLGASEILYGDKPEASSHNIPFANIEAVRAAQAEETAAEGAPGTHAGSGWVVVTHDTIYYFVTEDPDQRDPLVRCIIGAILQVDEAHPFAQLAKRHELRLDMAHDLYRTLSQTDIVVLCDDSGSMAMSITEPATATTPARMTTRWLELKKLTSIILEYTIAVNPHGVDLVFLNRGAYPGVQSVQALQPLFQTPPGGGTPLSQTLERIYTAQNGFSGQTRQKSLLIVIISDGEPSDPAGGYGSSIERFKATLQNKNPSVYVTMAECTDNEEDMNYIEGWQTQITNFANTDDYREDLARVRQVMGPTYKYDYTDYVVKILLAPFYPKYRNLDSGVLVVECCAAM
jgi:hypothetical protein